MINQQNITFGIAILTTVFVAYNYFRNPQIKSDKVDAVFAVRFNDLEKQLVNLRDNHMHTFDMKLDTTNNEIGAIKVEIAKLSTTIEERIPKRT